MASKIVTIFTQTRSLGKENINVIKGRDYFDLLWFLEKKVTPNLNRINDLLKTKYSMNQVIDLIDKKSRNCHLYGYPIFKTRFSSFYRQPSYS